MALSAGSRLGPHEILSLIGAGGMGAVYKAKGTRLERIVAIKVLPSHLSDNPDLKQRLEREARAVSSLNHGTKAGDTIPEEIYSVSGSPAVSPDGRHVVFRAWDSSGTNRLWIRSLGSLEGRPLPGTEWASGYPFWSPDSQFVGFFTGVFALRAG